MTRNTKGKWTDGDTPNILHACIWNSHHEIRNFAFFILKQIQQYKHANCKHTYTYFINHMTKQDSYVNIKPAYERDQVMETLPLGHPVLLWY